MVHSLHLRRLAVHWRGLLATGIAGFLLTALAAGAQTTVPIQDQSAQNQKQAQKPLPLKPGVPGMGSNHRLILKDGTYQIARTYEIVGNRVRYFSQERGDWEELPVDLVDWNATRKWENDHSAQAEEDSPAMKEAAELDKEEAEERADESGRMPQVAKGLELPDQDGVFVLDTFEGTPELVELKAAALEMHGKSHRGITMLDPLAGERTELELEGAHATVHLHVNDPAIYLSLDSASDDEPLTTHAFTVKTDGANDVASRPAGAHSASSGFAIVRVDERKAYRFVGAIHVSPTGKVTPSENVIPTTAEVLPGKHWLKITPAKPLTIGDYALVEILSPTEINQSVWDFRVNPTLGDNLGSLGPILQ